MRRLAVAAALLAVLGALVAGCGSSSSGALDESLGYLPKDAPFVAVIETNPDGEQVKSLDKLVSKFPFADQAKETLKHALERSGDVSFDKDIKPLLGNPLVVGVPSTASFGRGGNQVVATIEVKDKGKLDDLLKKSHSRKLGERNGATLYEGKDGSPFAVKDDVLVLAGDRRLLEGALDQRGGGDRLRQNDFETGLGDLSKDALVRATGDLQALLRRDRSSASARKVPWVGALRSFGFTVNATDDGLAFDFRVKTDKGALSDADLPLPSGDQAPKVVKRPGEVSIGIRDPRHVFEFGQQAAQGVNPSGFGQFEQAKRQVQAKTGVDVDRDLVGQLTKDASANVGVDGRLGVRAELKDPAAFARSLRKVARRLPELSPQPMAVTPPRGAERLYTVRSRGKTTFFGVERGVFVLSNDRAMATALAAASPESVSGAKGSVVVNADAEQLANAILRRSGRLNGLGGLGAGFVTGPLDELKGSVTSSTDELRGSFTLGVQ